MPLNWVNIRTGLKTVAETEPQIAALWASSDHSPNITQGQDFGWRLAPEVVVEMKQIMADLPMLERIAARFKKGVEDLGEIDILHWISNKTTMDAAPTVDVSDFADDYDRQVRLLEGKPEAGIAAAPMTDEELLAELASRGLAAPTATTVKKTTDTKTTGPVK
jgi:hypothetical protein